MPPLTCYRLVPSIRGKRVEDFRELLDLDGVTVDTHGPYEGSNFRAHVLLSRAAPRDVPWSSFLREGFGRELTIARSTSPSALLIVELSRGRGTVRFAFPFGPSGRFLLAGDSYQRGYGLRTALNLIYPRNASSSAPTRLRAVDTKRRGPTTTRSRVQASSVSSFELFNVDRLQDVVKAATGAPANSDRWGRRVTGGDALGLDVNLNFAEIGALCRRIDRAHAQSDYQDNFDWIDYVQPISDPALRRQLENEVVERLRAEDPGQLELAPPQIVDWDLVSAFHYHFDRPQGEARSPVTHPDLRIVDYLRGLADRREDLAVEHLRQRPIEAVDASGNPVHKWSVWRCLVGQFSLGQRMYILDEGEFFEVRGDYLSQLDEYVSGIPRPATELPPSPAGQLEGDYNAAAASASQNLLLMDKQLVRSEGRTSPVEVCDILSTQRELIHIKRHLGSSDLSHLFSQGFVSAELIQRNPGFRSEVHALVDGLAAGRPGFSFFDDAAFASRDYTVVYGIVASWNGRRPEEALPFFSKVNLRGFVDDLRSREFNVALTTIEEVRVGSTCSQRDGPLHQ